MMYWNINNSGGSSTTILDALADVVISSPQLGNIIVYNGSQFVNSDTISGNQTNISNINAANITSGTINSARLPDIDAAKIATGTLAYARLPTLYFSGTESVAPYVSAVTPGITPSGLQNITISGDNFTPNTTINFPGATITNLVYCSPQKITFSIDKTNLAETVTITVANGLNTNQVWYDSIKSIIVNNDPQWNYVSLFLKGEGSNNSTSIIDSSLRNRAINRFGDVKISTNQFKYGSSSLFFDGIGDYLTGTLADSDIFTINSNPFTIEAWIYPISAGNFTIFGSGENFYPLQFFNGAWRCGDGVSNIIAVSGQSPPLFSWTHMALTFDGAKYKLFKNKVKIAESSTLLKSYTVVNFEVGARIGQNIFSAGYIDSLQVINFCRADTDLDLYLNS